MQEAAARAAEQAAQESWGGGSVPVVDPGGPGHPEIVALAQRELGDPYVFAAAGPSSFDCSGLTMYCYAQIGIGLAHAATAQQQASKPVPLGSLLPGDLVFFSTDHVRSYHVGIYVGGGSMIHAPAHRRRRRATAPSAAPGSAAASRHRDASDGRRRSCAAGHRSSGPGLPRPALDSRGIIDVCNVEGRVRPVRLSRDVSNKDRRLSSSHGVVT